MEKTEVIFVPATEADAPTVGRLRQTVWQATYRGIFPDAMIDDFAYDWHRERDLRRIKSPDYAVWLMVAEGKHIGYLILKKDSPVLLNSLYILPEYQRRGLGKRAFLITRNYCLENGEDEFICHCQPENKNAMSFYEKMGGIIAGLDLDNEESWQNSVIWRFAVKGD